jgi:FMN-dependent NADH-azoreductase
MSNLKQSTLLKINSSGRYEGSHSRALSDTLVTKLMTGGDTLNVIERELAEGVEFIDQDWIFANFTSSDERSAAQKKRLEGSDKLVRELEQASTIVIGMPIYNFGPPAVLKAWIDQVARAGLTFHYSPDGPVGLLQNKKAYLVVASGGTEVGSAIDFATDYMKHTLGFIGIADVTVITAERLMADEMASLSAANNQISGLQIAA